MIFYRKELALVKNDYFSVLRVEDRFVTVQSRNTGHIWMIFKKTYEKYRPVVLHHKHSLTDKWFHEHKRGWTVAEMVEEIKRNDEYVQNNPDYMRKMRNGRSFT